MNPTSKSRSPRCRGFTLVELMVTIVIIAVLASLAFVFSKRGLMAARRTEEMSNIRQAGTAVTSLASEYGYYPMGYDNNRAMSWASLVVEDMTGGSSDQKQAPVLWSPLIERNIPLDAKIEAVTHFGCNPAIMTDARNQSQAEIKPPKFRMRPSQLTRPAEQILLAGAVPRGENAAYGRAHAMMWAMRPRIGGNGGGGRPPQLDKNNANRPINFPDDLTEEQQYGSLPDFFRGGDGRALFLHVDGSVQRMAPGELKEKHWAVSY